MKIKDALEFGKGIALLVVGIVFIIIAVNGSAVMHQVIIGTLGVLIASAGIGIAAAEVYDANR